MQNVTDACFTLLFNNLIPTQNSYFNDYQGLSDVPKGNVQVEAKHSSLHADLEIRSLVLKVF